MVTIVDVGFKNGDVITLKLNSGEEVIGRYEDENENFMFLSRPLTVMSNPQGFGMMQSIVSMDMSTAVSVGFKKGSIVAQVATKEDIASHYLRSTTGIEIASEKNILMG